MESKIKLETLRFQIYVPAKLQEEEAVLKEGLLKDIPITTH